MTENVRLANAIMEAVIGAVAQMGDVDQQQMIGNIGSGLIINAALMRGDDMDTTNLMLNDVFAKIRKEIARGMDEKDARAH